MRCRTSWHSIPRLRTRKEVTSFAGSYRLAESVSAENGSRTSGEAVGWALHDSASRDVVRDNPMDQGLQNPAGAGVAYLQPRLSMSNERQEMTSVQASVQASQ